MRRAVVFVLLGGCASNTFYTPTVVARGEITLSYQRHFVASAGGEPIAHGLGWRGLEPYVACVDEAKRHAHAAARAGDRVLAFSITGGIFGGASVAGFAGIPDEAHRWIWFGTGLGTAAVGLVFALLSRLARNEANGHAVDAINFYNDRVGSLGATCNDLRYPAPASADAPATAP